MVEIEISISEECTNLSREEKKKQLFVKQKNMLDIFLDRKAISEEQYDKSLGDLSEKMGMQAYL